MNEVPLPSPDEKTNQLVVDPVVHLSVVIIAIVMSWSGGGGQKLKIEEEKNLRNAQFSEKIGLGVFFQIVFL